MSHVADTKRIADELREAFLIVMRRNANTAVDKVAIAETLARVAGAMVKGAPVEVVREVAQAFFDGAGARITAFGKMH